MNAPTEPKREPYPLAWLLAPLALAWIVPGLFGHEPWKPDEGYTIGMVKNIIDTGDWIVPRLAGEPFMEKPPVFYITAALLGTLFSPWLMPLHQAMALAAALYVGVTFLFAFLAGREAGGTRAGVGATLGLMGCIGFLTRGHSAITDTALWAGFAVACYGMVLAGRRLPAGAFWFGTGAGLTFMAKGLLGPGIIGLSTFLLPVFCAEWRGRRFVRLLVLAFVFSLPWLLVWPVALFLEAPPLFRVWFVDNNIGRFFGSAFGYQQLASNRGHGTYLIRFPWFCLPLWPPALVLFVKRGREAWRVPASAFPVLALLVGTAVLSAASSQRDLYFIPLLVPLALLAAQGSRDIPSWLDWPLRRLPILITAAGLTAIWGAWLCWRFGLSAAVAERAEHIAPGLTGHTGAMATAAALVYTILWAIMIFVRKEFRRDPDWVWALCITVVWGVAMLLYMPILNHVKGYRTTFAAMMEHLPADPSTAVESYRLGEPQRAILDYYFNLKTRRIDEAREERERDYLLVQNVFKSNHVPDPGPGWEPIWEGTRPSDDNEGFTLYRRATRKTGAP